MSTPQALRSLMVADFLERIRRYGFLIVLVATVVVGYSMVPAIDEPYNALAIGNHRPYYSSAWIGTVFGIVVASLLTLLGFFLVRGAVPRDRQTRVGLVIATTPISKTVYALGKWLSNMAVFVAMLLVLTVVALIMQFVRAEDLHVNLWALAAPIWCMGLPTLALVAALSVLLECLPLPSIVGNIVFVVLWGTMLLTSVGPIIVKHGDAPPANDIAGVSHTMIDLRDVMVANGLDPSTGATDLYQPTEGQETIRFHWQGISWSPGLLFQRSLWLALSVVIAATAAIPFDRFDPARHRGKPKRRPKKRETEDLSTESEVSAPLFASIDERLSTLEEFVPSGRFSATLVGELRLMLRARSKWWLLVVLGLFITCLVTPHRLSHGLFAPLAWLWPMLVWSGMGCAEHIHRTSQVVFSSVHIVRRQLPALWTAGVIVAAFATGATAIRFALSGEWLMLCGWCVGVLFVPTLALALGVWTNSGRLFEIVYFVIWFLGVWHPVRLFDFTGRSGSDPVAIPLSYLALTGLLLVLAALGRQKQVMLSTR